MEMILSGMVRDVVTTDDIEMRLCCDQGRNDEDITVETLKIYVQWHYRLFNIVENEQYNFVV